MIKEGLIISRIPNTTLEFIGLLKLQLKIAVHCSRMFSVFIIQRSFRAGLVLPTAITIYIRQEIMELYVKVGVVGRKSKKNHWKGDTLRAWLTLSMYSLLMQ